jgi:hypothetical protein
MGSKCPRSMVRVAVDVSAGDAHFPWVICSHLQISGYVTLFFDLCSFIITLGSNYRVLRTGEKKYIYRKKVRLQVEKQIKRERRT